MPLLFISCFYFSLHVFAWFLIYGYFYFCFQICHSVCPFIHIHQIWRKSLPDNTLECLSRNTIHSFFSPYFFYWNAFNNICVLIFGFVLGRIILKHSHICGFIGIEVDCIRTDYYKDKQSPSRETTCLVQHYIAWMYVLYQFNTFQLMVCHRVLLQPRNSLESYFA